MDPLGSMLSNIGDAAGNAVNGFFAISGFLITGSWLSRGAEAYLRARVVRIWPAFAVAFVLSALIAAAAAGEDWLRYLRSIPKQSWVVGIFTLSPFELERPLSFANNPYPRTVNGPMWTIPIEFCCYMAVALGGSIGVFRRRWLVVVFAAFAMTLATYEQAILPAVAWQRWARFAAFFSAGSLLYLYRREVPKNGWLALGCLAVVAASKLPWVYFTLPLAGTYLLFYAAFSAPTWFKRFGVRNDISYGVYLYGGPLQQWYYSYAVKGAIPMDPWICFAVVLPVCVALGWVSWLFVEKPAKNWFK